jgi:hypothetical protein
VKIHSVITIAATAQDDDRDRVFAAPARLLAASTEVLPAAHLGDPSLIGLTVRLGASDLARADR